MYALPKKAIAMFPHKKLVSMFLWCFILVFTLALLCTDQNASATSLIGQLGVQYSIYNVIIQGKALDIPFQREGMLLITHVPIGTAGTENGQNPFELFLSSGNPGAAPESGAIWFMTNNAFLGNDAQIDLAFTAFDPDTQLITVQADPNLSAVDSNVFNARSGLLANAYQIFDGTMQIQSEDNWQTITGQLNILGTGAIFHSNSQYIAEIRGVYAGEGVV
jgi:hypothetical protein